MKQMTEDRLTLLEAELRALIEDTGGAPYASLGDVWLNRYSPDEAELSTDFLLNSVMRCVRQAWKDAGCGM